MNLETKTTSIVVRNGSHCNPAASLEWTEGIRASLGWIEVTREGGHLLLLPLRQRWGVLHLIVMILEDHLSTFAKTRMLKLHHATFIERSSRGSRTSKIRGRLKTLGPGYLSRMV